MFFIYSCRIASRIYNMKADKKQNTLVEELMRTTFGESSPERKQINSTPQIIQHSPHISPQHQRPSHSHSIIGTDISLAKQWGSAVLVTFSLARSSCDPPNSCITVPCACCPSYPSGRTGLCPAEPGLLPPLLAHGAGMHCSSLQGGGVYLTLHHHCLGVWKTGNVTWGASTSIIKRNKLKDIM